MLNLRRDYKKIEENEKKIKELLKKESPPTLE